MATVTTATASLDVDVRFVCSSCGTPNIISTTLRTYANSAEQANEKMKKILTDLSSPDLSKRYTHANLQCRCLVCKHKEPWAGLNFYKLNSHILAWGLVGLLCLLPGVVWPSDAGFMRVSGTFFLLVSALIFCSKLLRGSIAAKKIAALAPQCLPVVTPRRKETPQDDIMARVRENMNRQ